MDKIKRLAGSRKFWAALIGLLLIVLKAFKPDFPLQEDQLTGIVVVIVGYILGVAVEDGGYAVGKVINSLFFPPGEEPGYKVVPQPKEEKVESEG
jgi:hypothetical protein